LTERIKIQAVELIDVRLTPDRTHLELTLRDPTGRSISLILPTICLNTVLAAMPGRIEAGTLHALDTWSMVPAGNGQDMVLTLRTPDGLAISFAAKPWQVEGMATIATYGRGDPIAGKSIH
jgi:hypothetical protein